MKPKCSYCGRILQKQVIREIYISNARKGGRSRSRAKVEAGRQNVKIASEAFKRIRKKTSSL